MGEGSTCGWGGTHSPALGGLPSLKPSLFLLFLGERSFPLPLEGEISPEVRVIQVWAGLCLGILVINGLSGCKSSHF